MSNSPPSSKEYAELMSIWFDELTPMLDEFKHRFTPDAEGYLRYLMALHIMITSACEHIGGLPVEAFDDYVMRITAVWFAAGMPKDLKVRAMGVVVDDSPEKKPN